MARKYTIPLRIIELDDHSYHLLVEAQLNDLDINMIIDTGASRTVFNRKLLENMLRCSDTVLHDVQSAGIMADQIEGKMALADTFRIGDLIFHNLKVVMIDLDVINKLYYKVTGRIIHGLLGSDFLMEHNASIDYEKCIMILRKTAPEHFRKLR